MWYAGATGRQNASAVCNFNRPPAGGRNWPWNAVRRTRRARRRLPAERDDLAMTALAEMQELSKHGSVAQTNGAALVTASYSADFERCRLLCESVDRFVTGFQ